MKLLPLVPLALSATASPLERRAPAVTTADLTNFRFFSQYSGASYCNSNITALSTPISCPNNICPLVTSNRATIIGTVSDSNPTNIDGLLALDPAANLLVLTIRGSASVRNWIANILFAETNCPTEMFGSSVNAKDCGIHAGFHLAWASISQELLPLIKKNLAGQPGRRLVVTGHSLGGAVATVAAAYLRGVEKIPCDVYSFGSPRVGNAVFANAYNTLSSSYSGSLGKDFRVTHAGDPVPRLPPLISGFRHTGVEYWIKTEILDRLPGTADFKICEGVANTGCNAGSTDFSTDAHAEYFGDISGCGPDGGLQWRRRRAVGVDEETRKKLEMLAELDREFVKELEAGEQA